MLIRFSVENFLSFKDRQSFSMIAGNDTQKKEHKSAVIGGITTLKTSVLFGSNGSGKSNLIKAIRLGKELLLNGTAPGMHIDYQKFRLDKDSRRNDSRIEYEIQHKGKNYAYGFVFNHKKIKEEWLFAVSSMGERKIFERDHSKLHPFDLEGMLKSVAKEEEKQFLRSFAKGTPDYQLFLTEMNGIKIKGNCIPMVGLDDVFNIIDWFINRLKIVLPEDLFSRGIPFEFKSDGHFIPTLEAFLTYFGTDIHEVRFESVHPGIMEAAEKVISKIQEDQLNKDSERVCASILSAKSALYLLSVNEDGELFTQKFMTSHCIKGSETLEKFDSCHQSEGTKRLISLTLLLIELLSGDRVIIIDDMDRSLHPNLMVAFIDLFLRKSGQWNSQLIFTSHETELMNERLLRKDEIWFVEKDRMGETKLHSLEQYNVPFDKHTRKGYLLGRFRAIPRLGNRNDLSVIKD